MLDKCFDLLYNSFMEKFDWDHYLDANQLRNSYSKTVYVFNPEEFENIMSKLNTADLKVMLKQIQSEIMNRTIKGKK